MNLPLWDEDAPPIPGEDVAYTPPKLAAAIVEALQATVGLGGLTWEPHAGGGAIVQALDDARVLWVASTLEPGDAKRLSARFKREIPARDALWPCPWTPCNVLANPPFSNAAAHVQAALEAVRERPLWTVAMILPLGFACRKTNAHLFTAHWSLWPISPRPTFTGPGRHPKGTAMTDVGLYVWNSQRVPSKVIRWRS